MVYDPLNYTRSIEYEPFFSKQSPYQKVELARISGFGLSMILSEQLQFTESEERRYHANLVAPALLQAQSISKVLIVGGGDGLALRDVLAFPGVDQATLVDIDPVVLALARTPPISNMNQNSLAHPKARVIQGDALRFMRQGTERFDVLIVDFPDPTYDMVRELYKPKTFDLLREATGAGGTLSFHGTSLPHVAAKTQRALVERFAHAKSTLRSFQAIGPTYFILASDVDFKPRRGLPGWFKGIM